MSRLLVWILLAAALQAPVSRAQLLDFLFSKEINRAVSSLDKLINQLELLVKTVPIESEKWRVQVNNTVADLDFSANKNIILARQELQDLVNSTVTTGDCSAQYYIHKIRRRAGELVTFLRTGRIRPPAIAHCATDKDWIDLASQSTALIRVYGFGFRSAVLDGTAKPLEFRVQIIHEGGEIETLPDKTIVKVATPYQLTVDLSGANAKVLSPNIETIQVLYLGNPPVTFAPVTIGRKRVALPVEVVSETGDSSQWPHARATARPGYMLVGGGCESSLGDEDGGHLLVWSYPDGNSWVCRAREHSAHPLVGQVTAHAVVLKRSAVPDLQVQVFPKTSAPQDPTAPPKLTVTQTADVPDSEGWVLLGGGCKTSWSDPYSKLQARDWLNLTGSYSAGPNQWTCSAAVAPVKHTHGTVTAYAIGARSRSFGFTQVLRESMPKANKKAVVAIFDTNRLSLADSSQFGPHVRVVGGGCRFSNGSKLFMTKSFPLQSTNGVRGWRCVFSDHGDPGTGDVEATAQGIFQTVRSSRWPSAQTK